MRNIATFQNAFRCRTIHLSAKPLFADVIAQKLKTGRSRFSPRMVAVPSERSF
ncbi:hypothetical protein QN219_14295 [Sinorhizobium sp. 7-81]|uniref:hypothetical protein n=1 Tax=Sinorhizobium sp. 8-89 TaxID=3049089 RepID=UPI0024C3BCE4|nr:hypothetical protein [Sinorhizobium sp. 8-89]MDK1491224.1 hypothetical protein [Sinorhizobium sp. 8-89]